MSNPVFERRVQDVVAYVRSQTAHDGGWHLYVQVGDAPPEFFVGVDTGLEAAVRWALEAAGDARADVTYHLRRAPDAGEAADPMSYARFIGAVPRSWP